MTISRKELYLKRRSSLIRRGCYSFIYYKYYDYDTLNLIMQLRRKRGTINDCIIMADTETSKEKPDTVCRNYVVAWTITIRAFDVNIVTLYGQKPSEIVDAINKIIMAMKGDKTVIYIHNLPYDWTFLRKFFMRAWGTPDHQLNVKSHYPIFIEFENGIILRDSLILAQRSLEKWAIDMNVKHQKAVGFWDYDIIRHQKGRFTPHEKTYIEHDTLAGVECIQATCDSLHKHIGNIPLTATGIPREMVQKLAAENKGRQLFLKICMEYALQEICEQVFHGGYTHGNRHFIEKVIYGLIKAYDEASAYPYVMLSEKYPMEKFAPLGEPCSIDDILSNADDYAYMFKLILIKPKLKNNDIAMPALQYSKCTQTVNVVLDNGRILCAEYAEIWLNEIDLEVIAQQYDYKSAVCVDVYFAEKDYLPRWFTDFIYQCFVDKTNLKGGDPVLYAIAKAKLNSLYGMCVQHPVKLIIEENYQTGDYDVAEDQDPEQLYEEYIKNRHTVLPYQWGCWVTSYAFRNLFRIGACAGTWLYSDTDSCYGMDWDEDAILAYNNEVKRKLTERGYGAVLHNGREYWLGVCEVDGEYSEFICAGAKRYAVRDVKSGRVKITVAGVPKKGFQCLNDDLHNFKAGLIFDGKTTGKKQHTYFYEDDIWEDENGNERADSIDLSPSDYLLDSETLVDWEKIYYEDIEVQVYDDKK